MRGGFVGPVVVISAGLVLLANNFLATFDLRHWWPLVIIAVGFGCLLDRFSTRRTRVNGTSRQ